MKKFSLFIVTLLVSLTLFGCARSVDSRYSPHQDLLQEGWLQQINTNPSSWTRGVDPWFFSGEPVQLSHYAIHAPVAASMSQVIVRVPYFTNIKIDGDFKVQIMGQQERNSVEIIGPNTSVRRIAVETYNGTLTVREIRDPKSKNPPPPCNDAIVRIGVSTLHNLTDCGNGPVIGRNIWSNDLTINSLCGANIVLGGGKINLRQVTQASTGTTTVIGVYAPAMDIRTSDRGTVNLVGRIGVQSINSFGNSQINIIGADTNRLVINANGASSVKIAGYANLKKVNASGHSKVYLYWVQSNGLCVNASGAACVGLAGCVTHLQVNTYGAANFMGRYLRAGDAYVTTKNGSHANIAASQKVFASAADSSSIYYAGTPSNISRFTSGNATIIAVWTNDIPSPIVHPQLQTWRFKQS